MTVSTHSRGSHFVPGLQCAECQQPMPNRTGLLSHGRSKHKGIDPYQLSERSFANLPKISPNPPPITLPSPPVLEKKDDPATTPPVKLNKWGVPPCEVCGKDDFTRKTAWGSHRRIEHHIPGMSPSTVAAREKKEAAEKAAAKEARAAARLAKKQLALVASPTKSPTEEIAETFACDVCGREGFISEHGVAIHKAQAHRSKLVHSKQTTKGELVNGHAKSLKGRILEAETETETEAHTGRKKAGIQRYSDGEVQYTAHASSGISQTALAIGHDRFQELCKAIAIERDLPPRTYARELIQLIYAASIR